MWHPDEGTIHAWLDGALDAAEAARVEAHVATCAECAPVVTEARALIGGSSHVVASLDHEPGGVATRPVVVGSPPRASGTGSGSLWRRLHLSPALAAAAAVVLIAAGTWFTLSQRATTARPTEVAAVTSTPQVSASADSVAVATASAEDSVRRAYEEARRRAEEMREGSARSSEPAARAAAGMVAAAPPAATREANDAASKAVVAELSRTDAAPAAKARSAAAPTAMVFSSESLAPAAGCYSLAEGDRARLATLPPRFTLDTAAVQLGPKSSGTAHHAVRTEPAIAGSYWTLSGATVKVVFGATKTELTFAAPADARAPVSASVSGGGQVTLGRC